MRYMWRRIIFLLVLGSFFLGSCRDQEKEDLTRLVQEWQGKEILFPKNAVFTRFLKDTVDYKIPESEYKILLYVDSVGCTSCKFQLNRWVDFIHQVDSITDIDIPVLFFLQMKDRKEMLSILRRENFNVPVCIDRDGAIDKLNHFPKNSSFHAFLLDRDNRVLVIGNPVMNLSVQDLYIQEIKGGKAVDKLPNTTLLIEQTEYDMGIVRQNSVKGIDIYLRNTGAIPFRIRGITTSCECTEAMCNWRDILPGEKDRITVYYDAEEPGEFWRTVTVYGNIPEKSITLNIIGKVE